MFAVALLVAHKLRAGWRGWAALAVLTAVAGGVVLTAAAGALRTDSAYPRFLSQSSASDVLVSPALTGLTGYYTALTRLRGAAITAPLVGIQAVPVSAGGTVEAATRRRSRRWTAATGTRWIGRSCSPDASPARTAPPRWP